MIIGTKAEFEQLADFILRDYLGNTYDGYDPLDIQAFAKFDCNVDLRLDFIAVLDNFFAGLPKWWHGIASYQEMVDARFNNALQPEWPGFYLEYNLAKYIKEHITQTFRVWSPILAQRSARASCSLWLGESFLRAESKSNCRRLTKRNCCSFRFRALLREHRGCATITRSVTDLLV